MPSSPASVMSAGRAGLVNSSLMVADPAAGSDAEAAAAEGGASAPRPAFRYLVVPLRSPARA